MVRRPHRVAITTPSAAASTARTSKTLLPDGNLNALVSAVPDQAKKSAIRRMCMTAPARLLSPTAATAVGESTPDRWRYRTLSAIPPTLAGETRLTKDEADWVSRVGPKDRRCGTEPMMEMFPA